MFDALKLVDYVSRRFHEGATKEQVREEIKNGGWNHGI